MDDMNQFEVIKNTSEEFERLQGYMLLVTEKESEVYKAMKSRYDFLKALLMTFGVNLTSIDKITN